jgi:hypothetical protein
MQLYYALYDPATLKDDTYWTWLAGGLQKEELNGFYNEIAVKHLPPEPNKLEPSDLWGGVVRYRDWTVLYRYYNGGYDNKGRPERYVILTTWISADETVGIDLSPIFGNTVFKEIGEQSQKCPVPEISPLSESWTGEKILLNLQLRENELTKPFPNVENALKTFANIPLNRNAWVKITKQEIVLTVGSNPGPTKEELLQQKIIHLIQGYDDQIAHEKELYDDLQQKRDELEQDLRNQKIELSQLKEEIKTKNYEIQNLYSQLASRSDFVIEIFMCIFSLGILSVGLCLLLNVLPQWNSGFELSMCLLSGTSLIMGLFYLVFHYWLEW